ncbi:MAG: hypothetical protein EOO61_05615 [Hymenobacter sp.]|nr:MAG: hypothetical protein EOO61_05615 [Hymenobacter sp.]
MNLTTTKEKISKVWNDPVGAGFISTVLSTAFLAIVGLIWIKLGNHTVEETYALVIQGLAYKLPVYVFLSLIGSYFIVRLIVALVKPKRKPEPDPIWDAQIGHFSFRDLYTILSNNFLPVPTMGMEYGGREAPNNNLLILFVKNNTVFNRGVSLHSPHTRQDGGYAWGVLAPRLMEYGLVRQVKEPNKDVPGAMDEIFYTSETGAKFYATVEKLFLRDPNLYDKLNNYTWDKVEAQLAKDEADAVALATVNAAK